MAICGKRAFQLLADLSFERLGGSPEEEKAADILVQALAGFGVKGVKEPFPVTNYTMHKATLKVTEPYCQEYTVTGIGRSGCTPEAGLEAELIYVGEAIEADLLSAAGKIVLINGRPNLVAYERLVAAKVKGIIAVSGNVYDNPADTDLALGRVHEGHLQHGVIPGVSIRARDALELLEKGAQKVTMELQQNDLVQVSHNVVCEIPGKSYPDEIIVYTAHYDSVFFSSAANDNGAGSVILVELARHFAEHQPERTLRFVWCGSEEYGLLGSLDYVQKHKKELGKFKLNINIDVAGGYLGRNSTTVTGPAGLLDVIDYLCKEIGVSMQLRQGVSSSDSVPFAEYGIPGVNISRGGAPIHNRYDLLEYISPDRLAELAEVALLFSQRVVNSKVFPVKKELPDNVKRDLIQYLRNWRGAKMEIPAALK